MDEESDLLWARMTADVEKIKRPNLPNLQRKKDLKPEVKGTKSSLGGDVSPEREKAVIKGREIDRRTAERLRKGQITIEARLDLHGMSRIVAYDYFRKFIMDSHLRGLRCVLVITGKGIDRSSLGDPDTTAGVLKRSLPDWIEELAQQGYILKGQEAHRRDGGAGAAYILLRRKK